MPLRCVRLAAASACVCWSFAGTNRTWCLLPCKVRDGFILSVSNVYTRNVFMCLDISTFNSSGMFDRKQLQFPLDIHLCCTTLSPSGAAALTAFTSGSLGFAILLHSILLASLRGHYRMSHGCPVFFFWRRNDSTKHSKSAGSRSCACEVTYI